MKLKAVVARDCSKELRNAIEVMRDLVMARVIGPHLKRPDFGPAEFYIQECDVAVSRLQFCEVRLSGLSLTRDRSEQDFDDAAEALEQLYSEKIRENTFAGERTQLMVVLMLDQQRSDGSALVERPPVWIEGTRLATRST